MKPFVIPLAAWLVSTVLTVTLVAYVSPFIGPNIVVTLAGGYDQAPRGLLDPSIAIGPPIAGALIGYITWRLTRQGLKPSPAASPWSAILVFSASAALAAMGLFAFQAIMWTLHPMFCVGAPLLWIASVAVPAVYALRSIEGLGGFFRSLSSSVPRPPNNSLEPTSTAAEKGDSNGH